MKDYVDQNSYRLVKDRQGRTVLFPVERMTFLCFEVHFVTIGSQCFAAKITLYFRWQTLRTDC